MKTLLEVLLEEFKEFTVKNFSEGIYHVYCITDKDVRYQFTVNELHHTIVVINARDFRTAFAGEMMSFLKWWYKEEKFDD